MQTSNARWLGEIFIIYRFTVVGVIATLIHIGIAWLLISSRSLAPLTANAVGFSVAVAFSFSGQYLWVFRSQRHWVSAALRFLVIAGGGFAASTVALLMLLNIEWLSQAQSAVLAAAAIPFINYIGNRLWAMA